MKKKWLSLTGGLLCVCLLAASCGTAGSAANETDFSAPTAVYATIQSAGTLTAQPKEGWIPAAENAYLALYYEEKTANAAVFDKRTGEWWLTNPPEGETPAAMSQLVLSSVNSNGVLSSYNTYTDAVSRGQVRFERQKDGFVATYTLGRMEIDLSSIPEKLTSQRYDEISDRLDDAGKKLLKRRYVQEGGSGVWVRKSNLTADQSEKLIALFASIGYSREELEEDNRLCGVKTQQEKQKGFVIPLRYTLEEDSLLVSVDLKAVSFPKGDMVTSLEILPYFGALLLEEDGYLFVPDGSGALVSSSRVQGKTGAYAAAVYGSDKTLPLDSQNNRSYPILLPVFGVHRPGGGMLAVLEDGEALASVEAIKAGHVDNYARVFASYTLNATQNVGMAADSLSKFFATSERTYDGKIQTRYILLEKERAGYGGMAEVYRQYRLHNQPVEPLTGDEAIPFFLETVGAADSEISTLGVVHESYRKLTAYEDNIQLLEKLQARGVGRIQLILNGWMNGGVDQKLADRVDLMPVLGGKKGYQALAGYTKQRGVGLYPQIHLNTLSERDSLQERNRYASHTLAGKKSRLYRYDMVTGAPMGEEAGSSRLVLSPAYQGHVADRFAAAFKSLPQSGVTVCDLSTTAFSDYNDATEFLRPYAVRQSAALLKRLAGETGGLLLTAPNSVTASLGTLYTDIPESSSSYRVFEKSVPFYSMVFHGYADYSFSAINYTADWQTMFLRCAEYGACPKFRFIYENVPLPEDVGRLDLYAASYSRWLDTAGQVYQELNALLSPVRTAQMVDHSQLTDTVFRTSYSNGRRIYVNYGDEAVTLEGQSLPPRSASLEVSQ